MNKTSKNTISCYGMGMTVDSNHLEIRALLKERGLRATTQRVAVLSLLRERRAPVTHEQVMGFLGSSSFDKASIWRVLSDLAGAGIVRRMDLGDRVWRYELYDSRRTVSDDHPHFLCESCGMVTCLPPLEVRTADGSLPAILAGAQFHIRVSGSCGACLQG